VIGDDVAAVLPGLRAHAESLMVDSVLVERADGDPTVNDKGEVVPGWQAIYAGKCRLIRTDFKDFSKSAGEAVFDAADVKLALAITTETGAIRNGDRATVTAVDPVIGDPANLGRRFTVQRDPARSHPVERRFSCTEVS